MHDPLKVVENQRKMVGIGWPYSHEKCPKNNTKGDLVLSYKKALERRRATKFEKVMKETSSTNLDKFMIIDKSKYFVAQSSKINLPSNQVEAAHVKYKVDHLDNT